MGLQHSMIYLAALVMALCFLRLGTAGPGALQPGPAAAALLLLMPGRKA